MYDLLEDEVVKKVWAGGPKANRPALSNTSRFYGQSPARLLATQQQRWLWLRIKVRLTAEFCQTQREIFAVLSIWKYWYGPAHGGNTVKQYWTESQLQQDVLTQQWHPQTKDALTLILLLISGQIFHSNNRTPKQVPIQWPETGFHLYLWIGAICFPTLGVLQYWDILTSGTKEGRWTHSKICSVTVK